MGLFGIDDSYRSRTSCLGFSPRQLKDLERSSGLPAQLWVRTTPARFEGLLFTCGPLGADPRTVARKISLTKTRFCPQCLEEDGIWRLRWQCRWSVACVRHSRLLDCQCPKCDKPVDTVRRGSWPVDAEGIETHVSSCWSKSGTALCRNRLDQGSEKKVDADSDLVDAQAKVDRLLDGGGHPTIGGLRTAHVEHFVDLHALLFLCRFSNGRESRPDYSGEGMGVPHRPGKAILDLRGDIATFLPAAVRLTSLPDDELVHWMRSVGNTVYSTTGRRLPPASRFPGHSKTFAKLLREAAATTGYANTSARLGFDHRRHRRPDALDPRFKAGHVPQLFWKEPFDKELRKYFARASVSDHRGRRICSALLLRLIEPMTWTEAELALGFEPHLVSGNGTSVEFSRLTRQGDDARLISAIISIANQQAEEAPLRDFASLRNKLREWRGIDPFTWRYLLPGRAPKLSHFTDSPLNRAHASAWTWAEVTLGDPKHVPGGLPRDAYKYKLFSERLLPKIEVRLGTFAAFLRAHPSASPEMLRGLLIGDLIETGQIAPRTTNRYVDPELLERVISIVANELKIDRHKLLSVPLSADVRRGRLLLASLLKITAGCNWSPIGELFGCRGNSTSIRNEEFNGLLRSNSPERETHRKLLASLRGFPLELSTPPVIFGKNASSEERAHQIKAEARSIFGTVAPGSIGSQCSQIVCRELTDLSAGAILRVHGATVGFDTRTAAQLLSGREGKRNKLNLEKLRTRVADLVRESSC